LKAKWHILKLAAVCSLLVFTFILNANAQVSSGTVVSVVPAQNVVKVGDTLKVNVTISNVQNLYGIDVTFNWNSSTLQILSVDDRLGVESYTDGVLHETPSYKIQIAVNDTSQATGEHHIVATSQGEAAAFNGSGTITALTFNVTGTGQSSLSVFSELADHPAVGETNSELIGHSDVGGTVDARAPSPSPAPSPTTQPTIEPSQSAQPTTPPNGGDPSYLVLGISAAVIVVITIVGLTVYSKKHVKKENSKPFK
jgi:hypothetical protein